MKQIVRTLFSLGGAGVIYISGTLISVIKYWSIFIAMVGYAFIVISRDNPKSEEED